MPLLTLVRRAQNQTNTLELMCPNYKDETKWINDIGGQMQRLSGAPSQERGIVRLGDFILRRQPCRVAVAQGLEGAHNGVGTREGQGTWKWNRKGQERGSCRPDWLRVI
jgi:hypothetical protein